MSTTNTSRNNNKRKQENDGVNTKEDLSSRRRRVSLEGEAVPPDGSANNTASGVGGEAIASTSKSVAELMEDILASYSKKVEAALEALYEMDLHLDLNAAKREEVCFSGGLFVALQAMKKYPSSKAIQWKACQLLASLLFSDKAKEVFFKLDGVQVILNSMKRHSAIAQVQNIACGVLMNVTCSSDEIRKTVVELGAVNAIVKAMKTFPGSNHVQQDAISVLVNLAHSNAAKAKIVAHTSVISLVASSMKQYLDSSQIQCDGCCLFGLLAEDNNEAAKNVIRDAGGITAIARVMEKNKDNNEVMDAAKDAMMQFL